MVSNMSSLFSMHSMLTESTFSTLSDRLLSEHSSTLAQTLAPLSSKERSRRASYRATHSGKLAWEVKGLGAGTEESVPVVDLTVRNGSSDLPDLGRESLQGEDRLLVKERIEEHFTD